MSEVHYQHRTVAFLDILGFRKLVETNKVGVILNAMNETSNILAKINEKSEVYSLRAAQFSDSIVISAVNPGRNSLAGSLATNAIVLRFARQIALMLLHQGVLCRGGIALGDMYHDEIHAFGPALVCAYEIESELAVYPRIVVNDDVLRGCGGELFLKSSQDIIKDNDDIFFLNIYKREEVISSFDGDISSAMMNIQRQLEKMRGAASGNSRACAKICWAANYHRGAFFDLAERERVSTNGIQD